MSKHIAVILGAGPGTGAGIARAFAPTHHLALLSRSQSTLDKTVSSLPRPANATDIQTFTADTSEPESLRQAWTAIRQAWPDSRVQVAVFNAPGGTFAPGDFLTKKVDTLRQNLNAGVCGAFEFAQLFLSEATDGTLIFTGATAGLRGGAKFSTFSPDKFALRSLSQSLAREFGPKGIHVAHAIIDGLIDTERVTDMAGPASQEDSRLSPDAIGQAYLYLHQQHKSAWTQEMDLRPCKETF